MFRIHDVMSGWEGLNLPGLPFYADRSLILEGTAVVRDGDLDGFVDYLRSVRIGASRVIRVPNDWLVDSVTEDAGARQALTDHVASGGLVQFFSTTRHERHLLEALGLGWENAFSAPEDLSAWASCKASLRRLGDRLGLRDVFPVHRLCRNAREALVASRLVLSTGCDFLVLKRPDLASGDGMILVERGSDVAAAVEGFMAKHRGHEIIVEAGHRHHPMSVQWEIHVAGPRFVCATDQLIEEPFTHCGNVISSGRLPVASDDDVTAMRGMSEPFALEYWRHGYRGVCGFDFLRTKRDGRLYLLECNGRVTATTYAYGVVRQLAERLPEWGAFMSNVHPAAEVRDFPTAAHRLGGLLFDGTRGALPFNVRCLSLAEPKATLCCVGRDADDAQRIFADASASLQ